MHWSVSRFKQTTDDLFLTQIIRFWGGLSDRIGRKPVLLVSCAGTMLSLLIVGFSSNFWVALLGRAVGGGLSSSMGVVQSMVGEMTTNPAHERKSKHYYLCSRFELPVLG